VYNSKNAVQPGSYVSDGTIYNKCQMKDMKFYLATEIIIYTKRKLD